MQDQNDISIIMAIGCLVMFGMALSIILFVARHQRKMYDNKQRIQEIENEKQLALFKASIEAEDRQKEVIARNLHDSIKPMLQTLKLSLAKHQSNFMDDKFSHTHLNSDKLMIDEVVSEIQAACHDLIPKVLNELGLVTALEDFTDRIGRSGVIAASCNSTRMAVGPEALPKAEQVHIYRVCQELIANILKHSNCNQLDLDIFSDENRFCIEMVYNGNGITDKDLDALSTKGIGMSSLKTRVLILNAKLNYLKARNGYAVKFHIPMTA